MYKTIEWSETAFMLFKFLYIAVMNFQNLIMKTYYTWLRMSWLPVLISGIIIHQIFSLARDWSQRVTWANVPQLKLKKL